MDERPDFSYLNILIVDDDAEIRNSLANILEFRYENRIKVYKAKHGLEGLDLINRKWFDVIISDYRMPQMDGIEFLQRAHQQNPWASRIMITAYPDITVTISAINQSKVDTLLTKPIQAQDIHRIIDGILENQEQQWLNLKQHAMKLAINYLREHPELIQNKLDD